MKSHHLSVREPLTALKQTGLHATTPLSDESDDNDTMRLNLPNRRDTDCQHRQRHVIAKSAQLQPLNAESVPQCTAIIEK